MRQLWTVVVVWRVAVRVRPWVQLIAERLDQESPYKSIFCASRSIKKKFAVHAPQKFGNHWCRCCFESIWFSYNDQIRSRQSDIEYKFFLIENPNKKQSRRVKKMEWSKEEVGIENTVSLIIKKIQYFLKQLKWWFGQEPIYLSKFETHDVHK